MPAKEKITKEILTDIAQNLFRTMTMIECTTKYGLMPPKIERLVSKLRTQGAKIPKQPRVYRNSLDNMIQEVKKEHPENFA